MKRKKGFTLLELMIVVAIIGLIATVAIAKYQDLVEKANLGVTLGNLASLRSSLSIYYATYMQYPRSLDPKDEPQFEENLGAAVPYVKTSYPDTSPPYGNEVTVSNVRTQIPSTMGTGWFYNKADGYIYINSTATDVKGNLYTMY